MTSPLLAYANARILVPAQGEVSLVNGRWVEAPGDPYLVKCFLSRQQYSGVSSGSKLIPIPSQLNGEMMPGASGDQFFYRGYSLQWAQVPTGWTLGVSDESSVVFQQTVAQYPWMAPGVEVAFRFGEDQVMYNSKIQRSSGVYGGQGIDKIIYKEIGGVELQLTGGTLQN